MSGHSQQIDPMSDKLRDMQYFPAGLRHFVYWTSIFVVAQAMQLAFLTSWQQGGYSLLDTAWANAALLFGVVLLWFFCKWAMHKME